MIISPDVLKLILNKQQNCKFLYEILKFLQKKTKSSRWSRRNKTKQVKYKVNIIKPKKDPKKSLFWSNITNYVLL